MEEWFLEFLEFYGREVLLWVLFWNLLQKNKSYFNVFEFSWLIIFLALVNSSGSFQCIDPWSAESSWTSLTTFLIKFGFNFYLMSYLHVYNEVLWKAEQNCSTSTCSLWYFGKTWSEWTTVPLNYFLSFLRFS